MWPFNRKPSPQLSIIDIARNKMIAERDQHETALRYYETIANDATAKMQHHEAAYLAYDAILQRIEPREHIDFTDDEFDAAMADVNFDLPDVAQDVTANRIDASTIKTVSAVDEVKATMLPETPERKNKRLPKASGAAGAC